MTLAEIKRLISAKISENLSTVKQIGGSPDNRWYLVVPMLMDGLEYAKEWASNWDDPGNKTKCDALISELNVTPSFLN